MTLWDWIFHSALYSEAPSPARPDCTFGGPCPARQEEGPAVDSCPLCHHWIDGGIAGIADTHWARTSSEKGSGSSSKSR